MSFFETKENNSVEPGSPLFGNRLSYGHEYNENYHPPHLYLKNGPVQMTRVESLYVPNWLICEREHFGSILFSCRYLSRNNI